jgi:hypothetical protein
MFLSALALLMQPDYGSYSDWHIYAQDKTCVMRMDDAEWEVGITAYPNGRTVAFVRDIYWEKQQPWFPAMIRVAGTEAYHYAHMEHRDGRLVFDVPRSFIDEVAAGWLLEVYAIDGARLVHLRDFTLAGAGSAAPVLQHCIGEQ